MTDSKKTRTVFDIEFTINPNAKSKIEQFLNNLAGLAGDLDAILDEECWDIKSDKDRSFSFRIAIKTAAEESDGKT